MKKVHGTPVPAGVAVILTAALFTVFTGCENFLNGSKVKNELEEEIAYANAPSYKLNVSSSYGKISPNGTITKKVTDEIVLTFTSDSDYQFICWKAYSDSAKTKELSSDYIFFDAAKDNNTSFTFNKALADGGKIYIEPVCVKRPGVVTSVPAYEASGVYCDSSISVMFDQKMDESSIYYSAEEQKALESNGFTLLKDGGKCYGYQNGTDTSTIVYKNISITKRIGGENLLVHYGIPQFDAYDASILRISVNRENPPEAATSILVAVSKNFNFYNEAQAANITLSSDYRWSYYTNGSEDVNPPDVDGISVYFADENGHKIKDKKITQISDYFAGSTEEIIQKIETHLLTSGKIWVEGSFTDGAAGPASLKWHCDTSSNPKLYHRDTTGEIVAEGEFDLNITGGTTGTIIHTEDGSVKEGCCIDLSEVLKGKKGLYCFTVVAADSNGNDNCSFFNFVYDEDLYETAESQHMKVYRDDKGIKIEVINTGDGVSADHVCSYDFDYFLKVITPETVGAVNTYYFEFSEKDKPYTLFLCSQSHDKEEAVVIKAGGGNKALYPVDTTSDNYKNFGLELSADLYHKFKISSDPREFMNLEDSNISDAKIGIVIYSGDSRLYKAFNSGNDSVAIADLEFALVPEKYVFYSGYYKKIDNADNDNNYHSFDTAEDIDFIVEALKGNKTDFPMSVDYCVSSYKIYMCERKTWSARANLYFTYDGLEYQIVFDKSTKSENIAFIKPYYVLNIANCSNILELVKVYYWQSGIYTLDDNVDTNIAWALNTDNVSKFGNGKFEGFYLDENFDISKVYYKGTDCLASELMKQLIAIANDSGSTEFTLYTKWEKTSSDSSASSGNTSGDNSSSE